MGLDNPFVINHQGGPEGSLSGASTTDHHPHRLVFHLAYSNLGQHHQHVGQTSKHQKHQPHKMVQHMEEVVVETEEPEA